MMVQQTVLCQIKRGTAVVTFMEMRRGRGAKAPVERRALACDHAESCPKSAFCRLVNPLTTRLPFDPAAPAPAPAVVAAPSPVDASADDAGHRAS